MLPVPLQFLVLIIAGALNDRAQRKIEYLEKEIKVLRELLTTATGQKRPALNDEQRRALAIKGKALTPAERREYCSLVTPETILAWYCKFVTTKYDSSTKRKPGRPRKPQETRDLVIRLANENPGWGYTKIRDALRNGLKVNIGRTAIADILAEVGIEPAPERKRKRTWKRFLRMHWQTLYACDFFSVEALNPFGSTRYLVFFVMELKTRRVEIAGVVVNPGGRWMKQVARNLTDPYDGFLRNATHLIQDRDPLYTKEFRVLLKSSGVKSVRIPAKSPNCNAFAERFVRTVRNECLDEFVIFGEKHLRHLLKEFMAFYTRERFHQGLEGRLVINPGEVANDNWPDGSVCRRSRLGGLLNFYERKAA